MAKRKLKKRLFVIERNFRYFDGLKPEVSPITTVIWADTRKEALEKAPRRCREMRLWWGGKPGVARAFGPSRIVEELKGKYKKGYKRWR